MTTANQKDVGHASPTVFLMGFERGNPTTSFGEAPPIISREIGKAFTEILVTVIPITEIHMGDTDAPLTYIPPPGACITWFS